MPQRVSHPSPTQQNILTFWLPLASTWWMMALEGPFLSALVARLPDPEFNLGAYGVTFAFAVLVESPVIMLMTASTALVKDRASFHRLRRFAYGLCLACTALLLLLLVPAVYRLLMVRLLALPSEIVRLTYGSLWILLPWPAAIGYRRFYQGLLIREGRTRLVALGTGARVLGMATTAGVLFAWIRPEGAHMAAAALAAGVTVEAAASRWMVRHSIRRIQGIHSPDGTPAIGSRALVRFYYPLALTSLIGLSVHPMVTFLMGRAPAPLESLAVLPVVNALAFLFRAGSLAYQEVVIALMGDRYENLAALRGFAVRLGLILSAGLALLGLTPLSSVWFETVSGLTPDLARFAIAATAVMVPLPFLATFLSLFRGVLVTAHDTRHITVATVLEVVVILTVFPTLSFGLGVIGVTAAAAGFLVGRLAAVGYLITRSRRTVRRSAPVNVPV